tara:strand:+ start:2956 stop:4506 length:1551 start_codon:yes stop_codon:yes gene_type:complete
MTDSISGQDLGGRDRVGISNSLIYNQKPAAVLARKIQYVGQANNQTYAPGGLVRLEIPTSPGTFLQSGTTTLKFDFNISSTIAPANPGDGSVLFDSTAASLIRRVRVYSGSSLIEDINEYSKIYELMRDATASSAECETTGSIEGSPNVEVVPAGVGYGQIQATSTVLGCSNVRRSNCNVDSMLPTLLNAVAVNNVPYQFEIPLMSGTIGTMCPKWFPLGAAGAAPLRVEIELNNNNSAIVQSSQSQQPGQGVIPPPVPTNQAFWSIENVELHCDIVQLDNNAMALVDNSVGGEYVVNTSSFRHSQANVNAGVNSSSTILPFRFSSAKAFLSRTYSQAGQLVRYSPSQTGATRANAIEYHHMIGSSHVPANNVRLGQSEQPAIAAGIAENVPWRQGAVEGVSELMKAVHGKNILQVSNKINQTNWNRATITGVSGLDGAGQEVERGTFTYAVDLESQGKASELIENGTSTVSLQCFLNVNYGGLAAAGTPEALVLHSWCMHDLRLEFVGGVCISRF